MLNSDSIKSLTREVQETDTFKSLKGDEYRGAAGFLDCCRGLSDSSDATTQEELFSIVLDYQLITSGYTARSKYGKGAQIARELLKQAIAAG